MNPLSTDRSQPTRPQQITAPGRRHITCKPLDVHFNEPNRASTDFISREKVRPRAPGPAMPVKLSPEAEIDRSLLTLENVRIPQAERKLTAEKVVSLLRALPLTPRNRARRAEVLNFEGRDAQLPIEERVAKHADAAREAELGGAHKRAAQAYISIASLLDRAPHLSLQYADVLKRAVHQAYIADDPLVKRSAFDVASKVANSGATPQPKQRTTYVVPGAQVRQARSQAALEALDFHRRLAVDTGENLTDALPRAVLPASSSRLSTDESVKSSSPLEGSPAGTSALGISPPSAKAPASIPRELAASKLAASTPEAPQSSAAIHDERYAEILKFPKDFGTRAEQDEIYTGDPALALPRSRSEELPKSIALPTQNDLMNHIRDMHLKEWSLI